MDEHPEGAPYPELVATILTLADSMEELDLNVSRITLPNGPLDEIHITTTAGYPVLFTRDISVAEQLEVLEILLSEQRANGPFEPEYIDVRVPGKAYFR
jgi:hypothetical protein